MRAALHDLAVIHHKDQVAVADGGQTVGYDQHGPVGQLLVDHVEDQILGGKVQIARGLVQDVQAGILQEGTRQCNALLLTAGQAVAGFLQVGVVLQRQMADELMGIGLLGGLLHFLHGGIHAGNADVVVDRLAEQLNVLRHIGNGAAHRIMGVLGQIHAVEVDLTLFGLVILQQQLGDGGLAAAAAAHQSHLFAGGNGKADVVQGRSTVAIAEGDVLELDVALHLFQRDQLAALVVFVLGGIIHDLGQTLHRNAGFLDAHLQTDQVAQRGGKVAGQCAERHEAAQRHLTVQHLADAHIGGQHAETGGNEGGDQALARADAAGPQADL